MSVPSTAAFQMDVDEVISAAMERLRQKIDAGYDIIVARRAIQFVFAHLSTRGINLGTLEKQTLTLVEDQVAYTLESDTQDIMRGMTYRNTADGVPTDIGVTRISQDEYQHIPDKTSRGIPNQYYLDRQRDAPVLYIWQAPDRDTYRLDFYRQRRFRDVGNMSDNLDVPTKHLGLMTAGVAHYIGMNIPELTPEHRAELKQTWMDELDIILAEDRDNTPLRIQPDLSIYARL